MIKKTAFVICSILFLNGCYTQFAVVRRAPPPQPEPQVTYEIDSLGDTVKVLRNTDTVVVKERENCYWTRNMWGEPEWRCGLSSYSHSWYLYNDYPWWYSSYPYYYDYSGRCPQYYYYDASCNSCRRYGGSGHYRNNDRNGGNTSSGAPVIRRSRSSTVPDQSTIQKSTSQSTVNTRATGNAASANETRTLNAVPSHTRSQVPSSEVVSGAEKSISTSASNQATPIINSRSEARPVSPTPSSGGGSVRPPANSQPASGGQSNESGNNDRNHRNPRSWQ